MNRDELRSYLGITGNSLGQIEKDYCQHIVLGALSREQGGMLVFKGGTALQKTGIIRRFSEDLDFTANGDVVPSKLEKVVLKVFSAYNYKASCIDQKENDLAFSFNIRIQGPLYNGPQSHCKIRLEVSRREAVLMGPRQVHIDPPYRDIVPYVLETMFSREMAAEKVRAIMTRNKPRDLYDLFMILRQGGMIDTAMAEKKLRYYDRTFNKGEFLRKCKGFGRTWAKDLEMLVDDVPAFKVAYGTIVKVLQANGKTVEEKGTKKS
jgi:predicted nucleotidyltransferase component of viral defense system